jgi:hypothetical protein
MLKTWRHEYPAAFVAQQLCFKIAADGITSRNGGGVLFTDHSANKPQWLYRCLDRSFRACGANKTQALHILCSTHAASMLKKQKHKKGVPEIAWN